MQTKIFIMSISSKCEKLTLLSDRLFIDIDKSCQFESKFDANHLDRNRNISSIEIEYLLKELIPR